MAWRRRCALSECVAVVFQSRSASRQNLVSSSPSGATAAQRVVAAARREHAVDGAAERARLAEREGGADGGAKLARAQRVRELLLREELLRLRRRRVALALLGDVGPAHELRVARAAEELAAAAAVLDSVERPHLVLVAVERRDALRGAQRPQLDEAVAPRRDELRAAADESELEHRRRVALEGAQAALLGHRPHLDRHVAARRREHLVDRREGDRPHRALVAAQRPRHRELARALAERPQLDALVLRARRAQPVVGRERHRVDLLRVAELAREQWQARRRGVGVGGGGGGGGGELSEVPELRRLVLRPREEDGRARAEGDAPTAATTDAARDARARRRVPDADGAVLGRRREPLAVGACVDGEDEVGVPAQQRAPQRAELEQPELLRVGRHEHAPPAAAAAAPSSAAPSAGGGARGGQSAGR